MEFNEPQENYITGWVKVYRSFINHWLWDDEPYTKSQAFLWMLLKANHKPNKFPFGNEIIECKRGEFITSQLKLSEKFKWNREQIRAFLNHLQTDQMIHQQTTNKYTKITICNYDTYQAHAPTDSPTNHQQFHQQADTNKNVKEIKEEEVALRFKKFMEWFNETTKRKFRESDSLKKSFGARLRTGYTPEQIAVALKNMLADKYHKETNFKYITPEFLLRQTKLDMYLNDSAPVKKVETKQEVSGESFYGSMI